MKQAEYDAFVQWRRDLAQIEEQTPGGHLSPFEKNIEVWKQLWRVIERSQLLVQIVDARNPYFFYSHDLETYITEKGGQFILLLNKSDFLSPELIKHWDDYFNENGIEHVFFSAKAE